MLRFGLRKHVSFCRGFSTMQKASRQPILRSPRKMCCRYMGGHGPDISVAEGIAYIVVGGGGIALWGVYKTVQMRERIEAFETGKVIPFKTLTDEEFFAFKKEFARLYGEEEDEEDNDIQENEEQSRIPRGIAKSNKDTVIFVDASED
uniref:uncharacterized protein LOC120347443 n=1 Tax=Styela clava TaxID=7725 RepID=UPI001939579E|nr:uncharacterized protein LOC120347443 [Styela clava]